MTATRGLSPLRAGGYGLPAPPRPGSWRIEPGRSSLELRVRELHRTSRLAAPVVAGEISMTASAGTSALALHFGSPSTERASAMTSTWAHDVGLDDPDRPLRYASSHVLASPYGWRCCGRLGSERSGGHFSALLVMDARIHAVYTRLDGHDVMDVTAIGAIRRPWTSRLGESLLRSRVLVNIRTHFVHD